MNLKFSTRGFDDYRWWAEQDRKLRTKIDNLIDDAMRSPYKGLGKPEPLRGNYAGWWSRRISDEHRMVYRINGKGDEQVLEIIQLRYHY